MPNPSQKPENVKPPQNAGDKDSSKPRVDDSSSSSSTPSIPAPGH